MSTDGIRALKQNASEVVARAAMGEIIEITDRGRPVARIVPLRTDRYQELVDSGQITPPRKDFPSMYTWLDEFDADLGNRAVPAGNTSGLTMEQILDELKEERL